MKYSSYSDVSRKVVALGLSLLLSVATLPVAALADPDDTSTSMQVTQAVDEQLTEVPTSSSSSGDTNEEKQQTPAQSDHSDVQPDPLQASQGQRRLPGEESASTGSVRRRRDVGNPFGFPNGFNGARWDILDGKPAFYEGDGTLFCQDGTLVIDVSVWNGDIDWQQVKAAGVGGAILRISYGWGNGFDKKFLRNIAECRRLGIPFGIYSYSYSYDVDTARKEAEDIVSLLRQAGVSNAELTYPVYYDLERWDWTGHTPPTDPNLYAAMVDTWFATLKSAGYTNLGVYSYTYYLNTALNHPSIHEKTNWVASYGSRTNFKFPRNFRGWQYSSSAYLPGISGAVDVNAFGRQTLSGTDAINIQTAPLLTLPKGRYYINTSAAPAMSLDIPNAGTASGTAAHLWAGNRTEAQQFDLIPQSDNTYLIVSAHSNKALGIRKAQAGYYAVPELQDTTGEQHQKWYLRATSNGVCIQSALGNWVLDVYAAQFASGTFVGLYEPNATSAQYFSFSSVSASAYAGKTVTLKSKLNSSLVLDVANGAQWHKSPLNLWVANGTAAQDFAVTEVGNGLLTFSNVNSGRLFEFVDGAYLQGAQLKQGGFVPNQASTFALVEYAPQTFALVSTASGKALDVPNGQAYTGAGLWQYTLNGTLAQQFVIEPRMTERERLDAYASKHRHDLPDGIYEFAPQNADHMRLDILYGSTANGANVQIYYANGTSAQRWRVTHDAQGYITFTSLVSNKPIDVAWGSSKSGTNVHQWDANGSYAQKWIATRQLNGSYVIYSALAERRALDIYAGSLWAYTNVWLYEFNGSAAQLWRMHSVG